MSCGVIQCLTVVTCTGTEAEHHDDDDDDDDNDDNDDMKRCSCYSANRLLGRPPSMISQLEDNSRDHGDDGKSIVRV